MGGGHQALAVALDDAVTHSDTPSLGDAPTHQAADLWRGRTRQLAPPPAPAAGGRKTTDDAVLDAEAQLVAQVRAPDEDGGHGGAADDVQPDPGLVLQSLHQDTRGQSECGPGKDKARICVRGDGGGGERGFNDPGGTHLDDALAGG